ncbi:hypothetical protein EF847_15300 [Actinobacteria bacterium YIM 96077]|uniref:Uncharacterized protein n=1 Tax=Phytoactinopolyspora halophila TaxID=1981511 RepID=A0A329QUA2_9ACTN|nr:hypothetical protein [Phytoactinopolyspora halophila]AYY13860.1 hypothetical protein EF847_15300 [Actinobacteria bacterium YIM 96077]RAW15596.1 hypothetical protein DPM12_08040 [Phytoactinopolyspora halophila]
MSTSVPPGRRADEPTLDALGAELRWILLVLATSAVLMSMIVLLMYTEPGAPWGAVVTAVVGCALAATAWLIPRRRLAPMEPGGRAEPLASARTLRSLGILVMVVTEVPAVVGIVASVLAAGWLPAFVGGVLATGAMLLLGPTKMRLSAWKDCLEASGARTGL